MIHSTIIFCCFVDLKSGDGRTDVRTTCAKIVITTGRDCGSASWINSFLFIYWNNTYTTEKYVEYTFEPPGPTVIGDQ